MTVKADKTQLRRIAEELVGTLLEELRQEQQQVLVKAQCAVKEATRALAEERARITIQRQQIQASFGDIHAEVRRFRDELARLQSASDKRDEAQDQAAVALEQRVNKIDQALKTLVAEREAVSEFERAVIAKWGELDATMQRRVEAGEQVLRERGKKEQDAVAAAGKHATEVAINARQEFRRAESSIKSIARGALRKLEKAGG